MNIPYGDIINLMEEIKSSKQGFISKFIRKRQINKIISVLLESMYKENKIYKKDFINFYNFLLDVSKVLAANIEEFLDKSEIYIYKKDNLNSGIRFTYTDGSGYTSSVYGFITNIETCDTFETQNTYFEVHEERIYLFDKSTSYKKSYEATCFNTRSSINGNNIYNLMIHCIIKYLNYIKEL